jgi:hypothetical protein
MGSIPFLIDDCRFGGLNGCYEYGGKLLCFLVKRRNLIPRKNTSIHNQFEPKAAFFSLFQVVFYILF